MVVCNRKDLERVSTGEIGVSSRLRDGVNREISRLISNYNGISLSLSLLKVVDIFTLHVNFCTRPRKMT